MDQPEQNGTEKNKAMAAEPSNVVKSEGPPQSLDIAKKGIKTGRDFANFMSALMSDLIEGKITPGIGNAACNAGGKLLKVVEMQMRYGQKGPGTGEKVLVLTGEEAGHQETQVQ